MRLSIPEILEQVVLAPSKAEKIAALQKHNSPVLRDILRINFDDNVKLDLPKGATPRTNNKDLPIGLSESNLYNEARRLYILEPGHPKFNANVKKLQRENIWIQILEGCHHTEAALLDQVKEKELSKHYKGLTAALVSEAFPGLLSEKVSKK
jgi:hypothetical protein